MNKSIRNRAIAGAAVAAVLLGAAACGTETVTETDPGAQQAGVEARIYPPVSVPPAPISKPTPPTGTSADAAERRYAADKARAERADALRAAQGKQIQNKLDKAGKPDRP
jgi:hypothetical protein